MPVTDPTLFLTFDDGPVPEVTPQTLDILKKFKAKATFFCIGENVKKYPEIFRRILEDGHAVGNHTFHHLNGWKTKTKEYIEDVAGCNGTIKQEVEKFKIQNSKFKISNSKSLFRPPYGKIKPSQIARLKKDYSIVMWDVLTRDYNQKISGEKCFRNAVDHTKSGSILVFHDSIKAKDRMLFALPKVLEHFSAQHFSFRAIEENFQL